MMAAVKDLTDKISSARGAIESRVDAIEKGISERLAERRTSEKWRSAIGTAGGYIGGWMTRFPWHHLFGGK